MGIGHLRRLVRGRQAVKVFSRRFRILAARPRRRRKSLPRGHLRQGRPLFQRLRRGRDDRVGGAARQEARAQALHRRRAEGGSPPPTCSPPCARSSRRTRTCPTRPIRTTGQRSPVRRATASSTSSRSSAILMERLERVVQKIHHRPLLSDHAALRPS